MTSSQASQYLQSRRDPRRLHHWLASLPKSATCKCRPCVSRRASCCTRMLLQPQFLHPGTVVAITDQQFSQGKERPSLDDSVQSAMATISRECIPSEPADTPARGAENRVSCGCVPGKRTRRAKVCAALLSSSIAGALLTARVEADGQEQTVL